jgi:hypothetical protein
MEEDGSWLSLAELAQAQAIVEEKAIELRRFMEACPTQVNLELAAFYRQLTVFHAYVRSKVCR